MIDHLDDEDLRAIRLLRHNDHSQPSLIILYVRFYLFCHQLFHPLKVKAFLVYTDLVVQDGLICYLFQAIICAVLDQFGSEARKLGVVRLKLIAKGFHRFRGVHFHCTGNSATELDTLSIVRKNLLARCQLGC